MGRLRVNSRFLFLGAVMILYCFAAVADASEFYVTQFVYRQNGSSGESSTLDNSLGSGYVFRPQYPQMAYAMRSDNTYKVAGSRAARVEVNTNPYWTSPDRDEGQLVKSVVPECWMRLKEPDIWIT